METIRLNNGVTMPMLGYGTFRVTDPEECAQSVYTAIRTGYRLIDTAQAYGNEAAVGEGVRRAVAAGLVKREDLFLTTKVWFQCFETDACRASLEQSLKDLGVDYIDLVLLHWPYGNVYAAWRVLEEYYAAGRIRAIGVSNMEADRFIDLIAYNRVAPAVNQVEVHLYCQRAEQREWMKKYGIAPEAYAPLGSGRVGDMFAEPALLAVAEKYGKTPAQAALRYLIQLGVPVIPKSVHEARIRENFDVFDFSLTAEDMAALAALDTGVPVIGNPESPERVERMTKKVHA